MGPFLSRSRALLRTLEGVLPASFGRQYRIRRERIRLARIDRATSIDATKLRGSLTATDLHELFADKKLESEWAEVKAELASNGITERADGINQGDRRALYYLVRKLAPRSVLEIGTHIGASTAHIAAALRNGVGTDARLVTVDMVDVNDDTTRPWLTFGARIAPRELVTQVGMRHAVAFVVSRSLEYLERGDELFDFIFLDGDHGAATVYREIPAALRRLAPGGVVLLHDVFPDLRPIWRDGRVLPGPWLAAERLLREGANFEVLALGSLPWRTKQKSRHTSLALLVGRSS
jgi:predicted O-methyltransferase YrrM